MKKEAPWKRKGAHAKDLRWKKMHPKNAKWLTQKTSDEKRGTPKHKGALTIDLRWKKRHPESAEGHNKIT
jgi:hypothetical protein